MLFLPSYSPNLNLIERLWTFIKRQALYGRTHPTNAEFQAAIKEILDGLSTSYAERLKSLVTLNCQRSEDLSLMGAEGITAVEIDEAFQHPGALEGAEHIAEAGPQVVGIQGIEDGSHQQVAGDLIDPMDGMEAVDGSRRW